MSNLGKEIAGFLTKYYNNKHINIKKIKTYRVYNQLTKNSVLYNAPNVNILYCLLESIDPIYDIITDVSTNERVSNRNKDNINRINSITIGNFDICKSCHKCIVVADPYSRIWFCNNCDQYKKFDWDKIIENRKLK